MVDKYVSNNIANILYGNFPTNGNNMPETVSCKARERIGTNERLFSIRLNPDAYAVANALKLVRKVSDNGAYSVEPEDTCEAIQPIGAAR